MTRSGESLLIQILHHDIESQHSVGNVCVMQSPQGVATGRIILNVKGGIVMVYEELIEFIVERYFR